MISGKAWGTTEPQLITPMIAIHRLAIKPHCRCSLHSHEYKNNAFVVLKGTLIIEVHKKAYALVDRTVLGPGDLTTVHPGEFHEFITGDEPVEAIEIYYPQWLEGEDIVRKNVGGAIVT